MLKRVVVWGALLLVACVALSARAISSQEAQAFLDSAGYPASAFHLSFTWDERAPRANKLLQGFHLTDAAGQPLDRYALDGKILDAPALDELGIKPRQWDVQASIREEPGLLLAAKAATPKPLPMSRTTGVVPSRRSLPAMDTAALAAADNAPAKGPKTGYRIGAYQDMPQPVAVAGAGVSDGEWTELPGGGHLWSLAIQSPGALGIRLEISRLSMPPGADVLVYNPDNLAETFGPYTSIYPGDTLLWTPTCFADTAVVECRVPPHVPVDAVQLRIEKIIHIYRTMSQADFEKSLAGACNLDVTCYPDWAQTARGIAGMGTTTFEGFLICTATLIADTDPCTVTPYVWTANHCISGQNDINGGASGTEYYWFYQTASCNGAPPTLSSVPRTVGGADFLAGLGGTGDGGGGSDFTLMRLRNMPPAAATYVGWTTTVPALGDEVVCIHHPSGDFKRISFGAKTQSLGQFPQWFHEILWHDGTTEHGSSGSPLMLPATHQIVGQLWGGNASCDNPASTDFFGRFDVSFGIAQEYLNPGPPLAVFANANYSVLENAGTAIITLSLERPAAAPGITVHYATGTGTAVPGADYVPVSGAVVFPPGQTTAQFSVAILDDTHAEPPKSLALSLTSSDCATLLPPGNAAQLTIIDDDVDTDGDGLSDYDEIHGVFGFTSDPNKADTDGDGLTDYQEVMAVFGYQTSPNLKDTDGDGLTDLQEILFHLNPLDPSDGHALCSISAPFYSEQR